jgi:hypothetical protein
MSKEWQTTDGANKCSSGCHQEYGDGGLHGWKEFRMQCQRQDWKQDSGRIDENGDWDSEDVSVLKKPIRTSIQSVLRLFVKIHIFKHVWFIFKPIFVVSIPCNDLSCNYNVPVTRNYLDFLIIGLFNDTFAKVIWGPIFSVSKHVENR